MNFLYPGFLFALFAVAIPILIHLFNFRKFKKVYFSNVAFLKEIKEQQSSREKLKNLLILLARILTIVFLVLAFAQPYFKSNQLIDQQKSNVVSIYIDNSYSMEAVNKEGSLLDEAKRRAKEIANSYQLNDKFQLLSNDFEGKHQYLLNKEEFLLALDEVRISAATRKLQQVLDRQEPMFSGARNYLSYIISDFQKGFVGNQTIRSNPNTQVSLVKLKANELPNVAIDSVWMLSATHQANGLERVAVKLHNYGEKEAEQIPLKLEINGQQKALSNINIPAKQSIIDTLSFSGLAIGWHEGLLSIKDYPITYDDKFNFSFKVSQHQQILSINGHNAENYLKTLYAVDDYFKLSEMSESQVNYNAFSNYSLIILNQLVQPSSGLAQELNKFLEKGGSVVVFPDLTQNTTIYTNFLSAMQLPVIAELKVNSTSVSHIELKNKLFKDVFETLPQNLDLPSVERYYSFKNAQQVQQETLLSLPGNQLFLARFPKGIGQIYLASSSLNQQDNNLAKHPVFVPIMYKIAFSSAKDQALYYTVMQDKPIELPSIRLVSNQTVSLSNDKVNIIPELNLRNGQSLLYVADQIKDPGFYKLKKTDSLLSILAFNQAHGESDMHYDSFAEIKKRFGKQDIEMVDAQSTSLSTSSLVKNSGLELWKICLILSIVFLAIEILLIRFYSTYKQTNT